MSTQESITVPDEQLPLRRKKKQLLEEYKMLVLPPLDPTKAAIQTRDLMTNACSFIFNSDFVIKIPILSRFMLQNAINNKCESSLLLSQFDPCTCVEKFCVSEDAIKLMLCPNAGGTSIHSEMLSFEILHRCFGATLEHTEMEIDYWPSGSKKTDYSCRIFDSVIGVSVTRAMKYNGEFTRADARFLLEKKLKGIIVSSENVVTYHRWEKQILHVWASEFYIAEVLETEFAELHSDIKHNTILMVTISANPKAHFLYLGFESPLPAIPSTLLSAV